MTRSRFNHRITTPAPPLRPPRRLPWRPGVILVTLLGALLVASPALSALRLGTKNADVLIGTKGNDNFTGAEGNDVLQGKAGNDTYFFADDWGTDTLIEKPGEGTDTLNFRGVHTDAVIAYIVPEWHAVDPTYPRVNSSGNTITFSSSAGLAAVEKVIGGQAAGDAIIGGGGANTLMPGGGALDELGDYGGWNDGPGQNPEIPASDDTYKGFADNTGTDFITDWGGTDVVDMRPLSTEDVYLSRLDLDRNGSEESLQIVTSPTAQVTLVGQYGPYARLTSDSGQQGRIEKILFADTSFTTKTGLGAAMTVSVESTAGKQAQLAEAADRLAREARDLLAEMPEPGRLSDRGSRGSAAGPGPGGDTGKDAHVKDKKKHKEEKPGKPRKHDTKDTRDKRDKRGERTQARKLPDRRGRSWTTIASLT